MNACINDEWSCVGVQGVRAHTHARTPIYVHIIPHILTPHHTAPTTIHHAYLHKVPRVEQRVEVVGHQERRVAVLRGGHPGLLDGRSVGGWDGWFEIDRDTAHWMVWLIQNKWDADSADITQKSPKRTS